MIDYILYALLVHHTEATHVVMRVKLHEYDNIIDCREQKKELEDSGIMAFCTEERKVAKKI